MNHPVSLPGHFGRSCSNKWGRIEGKGTHRIKIIQEFCNICAGNDTELRWMDRLRMDRQEDTQEYTKDDD